MTSFARSHCLRLLMVNRKRLKRHRQGSVSELNRFVLLPQILLFIFSHIKQNDLQ